MGAPIVALAGVEKDYGPDTVKVKHIVVIDPTGVEPADDWESLAELGVESVTDLLRIERPETLGEARARARLGIETLDRPRLHHLAGRAFYIGESLDTALGQPKQLDLL